MRSVLRVAVAAAVCGAMLIESSAWAARRSTPLVFSCEKGSVTMDGSAVLWPPNHRFHPYTVSYAGGAPGDVLVVSAFSSDGSGVKQTDPITATVPAGEDGASASVGLLAERDRTATPRMYFVFYRVSGSNACDGGFGFVVPTDGRPQR
jgi:hypothetical protein